MATGDSRFEDLTEREREVIALVARGLTNGQIGERLGISFETAKWHVAHIISKTGAETREEAVERWQAQRRLLARIGRRMRALVALPLLAKSVAVAGGVMAATMGVAVVFVVADGRGQGGPGADPVDNATPVARTATPAIATATPADPWWDEIRASLIASEQLELPIPAAAEITWDGVRWQVGAINRWQALPRGVARDGAPSDGLRGWQ
jgi:DNA-binding CsgD family transcriptional regulator